MVLVLRSCYVGRSYYCTETIGEVTCYGIMCLYSMVKVARDQDHVGYLFFLLCNNMDT
jgi:hypothetical protein